MTRIHTPIPLDKIMAKLKARKKYTTTWTEEHMIPTDRRRNIMRAVRQSVKELDLKKGEIVRSTSDENSGRISIWVEVNKAEITRRKLLKKAWK